MEKVSVILAFFNNEKTIIKSINSIFNQSYKNIELILVDDGSSDNSLNLIKKKFKTKKIKIFLNKQNKGLAYSLNKGINKSKCNLIFRMDADDISKKNRIAKQVNYMKKNPNISLLGTNAYYFDGEGVYGKSNVKISDQKIKKNILYKNEFIHSSVVFRKMFFKKLGGYNKSLKRGQDHDLWIRGKNFNYANIKEPLVYHYKEKKPKNLQTYFYMFLITSKHLFKNNNILGILFFFNFIILLYLKDIFIYIKSSFQKKYEKIYK